MLSADCAAFSAAARLPRRRSMMDFTAVNDASHIGAQRPVTWASTVSHQVAARRV
jgi:hypothetical protein